MDEVRTRGTCTCTSLCDLYVHLTQTIRSTSIERFRTRRGVQDVELRLIPRKLIQRIGSEGSLSAWTAKTRGTVRLARVCHGNTCTCWLLGDQCSEGLTIIDEKRRRRIHGASCKISVAVGPNCRAYEETRLFENTPALAVGGARSDHISSRNLHPDVGPQNERPRPHGCMLSRE